MQRLSELSAKAVRVAPIASADAHRFIRGHHYSGKSVNNSQLHIGAFIEGRLVGALQFGPPMDRSKVIGLVAGTPWNNMLELNRMAFIDDTPRNTESRSLAMCFRLIRKHAPHVEWVLSFADATQCGDGTVYRAAGFVLTGITRAGKLFALPNGEAVHLLTLESSPDRPRAELGGRSYFDVTGGRYNPRDYLIAAEAHRLPGFQLRYIYFLHPEARQRLTVPVLPFDAITKAGAGMYRGQSRAGSIAADAPAVLAGEGGSTPTPALHTSSAVLDG